MEWNWYNMITLMTLKFWWPGTQMSMLRSKKIYKTHLKQKWNFATSYLFDLIPAMWNYFLMIFIIVTVSTSNHMLGRAIWDKLPECVFENLEIARLKRVQFQIFQKSRGWFIPKIARNKHVINTIIKTNII